MISDAFYDHLTYFINYINNMIVRDFNTKTKEKLLESNPFDDINCFNLVYKCKFETEKDVK